MKKVLSYLLILTLTFTMLFSGVSFSFAAETQSQESDPAAGEVYVEAVSYTHLRSMPGFVTFSPSTRISPS